MAVSVPVHILGVPRSPDPAASGSGENLVLQKKAELGQKLALRRAYLGPVASDNCAKRCWSLSACAVAKQNCPQRGHRGMRGV